ncbi:MAG: 3-oxoacyl-[acyl-carrier-protein] synthase 3 [Bacteroidia bacterium]|nr:3-oxoacyl-[acyl-carrier-protein] synthase 3 [Bacteroidia bacterium]
MFTVEGIKLSGLAVSVPRQIISNHAYPFASEKERDLFIKTTGIENRRIAPAGLTASDLCFEAAEKLLREMQCDKTEIGVLLFITQTPDWIIPPTAIRLQHRLGLPKSCVALDINLGCSGYVYGLSVISSLMKSTGVKNGLLLVGDVSSSVVSGKDKSTSPIFSDAGSATLLEICDNEQKVYFSLHNDGAGYDAIIIPDGGMKNKTTAASLVNEKISDGIERNKTHLIMNGVDVFNFSLREVAPDAKQLLEYCGKQTADIDYFVFHQANLLMNEAIRKKLSVEPERVPYSLKDFGNTSSASIPTTMVTQLRKQLTNEKLSLLLSGFGVGLSWGTAILETDKITCLPLIEI